MDIDKIFKFLHSAEKLKKEMRHSWLSNGRHESVAEHVWRVSLMAIMFAPYLENKVNLEKSLKMAVVHDINEIEIGDVPAFLRPQKEDQPRKERKNMKDWKEEYKSETMDNFLVLWEEFESRETLEAKFIRALDRLEVRLQHIEADISTWNDIEYPRSQYVEDQYCEHDSFLKKFNEALKLRSKKKIEEESDKDFNDVVKEAEILRGKQ